MIKRALKKTTFDREDQIKSEIALQWLFPTPYICGVKDAFDYGDYIY
jgi:hypothetical protein